MVKSFTAYALVILIIILSGCIQSEDEKIAQALSECSIRTGAANNAGANNSGIPDACYLEIALKEESKETCEKISSADSKNTCLAIIAKDAALCEKISINALKDGCIFSVATAKSDTSLCDNLSEESKKASSQDKLCKATITLETKYCDEIRTYLGIGESEMKGACYAFIVEKKKDPSICETIPDNDAKEYCYLGAAKATNDAKYCGMISEERNRDTCFSNYASSTGKWKYCANITYSPKRDNCFMAASIIAKDPEGCETIPKKDECLQNVADALGDVSVCARITSDALMDGCYNGFLPKIAESGTVSDCEKITDKLIQYQCIAKLGENKKDPALCEKIPATYLERRECYASVLAGESSPSSCANFKADETVFKICNTAAAKNAKSAQDCDKIGLSSSKALCIALVKNDPTLCESITLGKWDAITELREVSECKTEIAVIKAQSSLDNALAICETIKLSESMVSRLNEMNDIETGKSQETYQKNKCIETVTNRIGYEKDL